MKLHHTLIPVQDPPHNQFGNEKHLVFYNYIWYYKNMRLYKKKCVLQNPFMLSRKLYHRTDNKTRARLISSNLMSFLSCYDEQSILK